jgi:hypothetical protein
LNFRKGLKTILAVVLLPACAGLARAVARVVEASGQADTFWVAALAGVACWLVFYLLLPRPMWLYVLGHEFTHSLWTWLFGGRVRRFRASAKGGQVLVTKHNFLISLAPYFFPLYAFLIMIAGTVIGLLWPHPLLHALFHVLLGAAYAFHLTLTGHILKTRQSDITQHGLLFSAVVIWCGNWLVLLLGIPLLTQKTGPLQALGWWLTETVRVLQVLASLLGAEVWGPRFPQ